MLLNVTRLRALPFNLRTCIRKVSQQLCNKPSVKYRNHISNAECTFTSSNHFHHSNSMIKYPLVICHRNSSDDSTSDGRIAESDSKTELTRDLSSDQDLVDFDEMLENIRKLKTEEDGDIKSIYTGKKKYRISNEERRTQPMTIEELVDFLTLLNGIDVCVIHVDPRLNYVTYLVTVTGVSTRHLLSMAKSLVYECKRVPSLMTGKGVHVEGIECEDWMAVNLGDIVVHFMLQVQRDRLELEKLWSLGHEYDDQYKLLESQLDS